MKQSLLALLLFLALAVARAAPMTNNDVIKLCGAKLDQALIITSVENSDPQFDVSPQGLISLNAAQVPGPVIAAMIKRAAVTPKSTAAADAMSPSDVIMITGQTHTTMRYLTPTMRSAVRGLGFGGFAVYAVLSGPSAAERIKSNLPTFMVSVPKQSQPESYVTIASLAVRKNDSREVMTGGGFMSYSTGITKDRVVLVDCVAAADQSKALPGFVIYNVTPKHRLAKGEYAVVLYTGEMHGLVSAWFVAGGNSFFDFGIDS